MCYADIAFSKQELLNKQSKRGFDYMNSVVYQEFSKVLEFYYSFKVFRQMWIRPTNCSWNAFRISMCGISGDRTFLWIDRSTVRKILGYRNGIVSKHHNFAASHLYMQFPNIKKMMSKWRGEISPIKGELFCEVGRKIIPETFVCLKMDTFFIHSLEISISNISMQINYRRS